MDHSPHNSVDKLLPHRDNISAFILAGGQSKRMDNLDKAFVKLGDKTLIAHVIKRIKPQAHQTALIINGDSPAYQTLGLEIYTDIVLDHPENGPKSHLGPLAGLLSAFTHAQTDYVLALPCDCPFIPTDLVNRMCAAIKKTGRLLCTVHDGERIQPAFVLAHRDLQAHLQAYLDSDERMMIRWIESCDYCCANFYDHSADFFNINTPQDLAKANSQN